MISISDGKVCDSHCNKAIKDFAKKENKLIIKNYDKYTINFVGYLEYIDDKEELVQIFSFPKHYNYEDNIKMCRREVIHSIVKATMGSNDTDSESINNIKYIQNIINYYHKYGLYKEIHKVNITSETGNINFAKTIKKKLPFQNNTNFVYHEYIVDKKQVKYNFITDAMAYVIEHATSKYDFYFNKIVLKHSYSNKDFKDVSRVILKLKEILGVTFKDEEKQLILNLIYYFENKQNSNLNSISICSTNYELVYEKMIHHALNKIEGFNFEKQEYPICDINSRKIDIDHLDMTNKVIVDSKYYIDDINKVDYKQLFYLQHISTFSVIDNYTERKQELNKWVNVLITPSEDYKEPASIVKRKSIDGLNLYTNCISINDVVNNYYSSNEKLITKLQSGIEKMRLLNEEN